MAYHTLIGREDHQKPWEIIFGDYDRMVVVDEAEEYDDREIYESTRILTTCGDGQLEINAAVAQLNEAEAIRLAQSQIHSFGEIA